MAIIDAKLAGEVQRQEREYAQRNDTLAAAQDWNQPPPAYEAADVATSSSSQPIQASSTSIERAEEGHQSELASSQRRSRDSNSIVSDESLPLLTRRQEQRKKKIKSRGKITKVLHTIIVLLLLTCVVLILMDLSGLLDTTDILPDPIQSDGDPIENPIWSPGVKTDPDLWPNPRTPLYSSFTSFNFDAFKAHFVHERSNGAINGGQINVVNGDSISDVQWKKLTQGRIYDQIHVSVEARYSQVTLRNAIRVNKMQMKQDKQGLGIYGAKPNSSSEHSYISFHIFVILPSERQRTPRGTDKDGSSFISELDIDVDNLRVGIEQMQDTQSKNSGQITFGEFKSFQSNEGFTFVPGLRANNSIDIRLQNGAVLELMGEKHSYSMRAPRINVNVVNGPIWLNRLYAKDEINLKTTNGGINVTGIAIAKSIKVKHATGLLGGLYRAEESDFSTSASDTSITIDLTHDLYSGMPPWEEEHMIVDVESGKGPSCQVRSVNVDTDTDTGDVRIRFQNHDSNVQLHSTVSVRTGSITATHDRMFEGTFTASNKIGSVEIKHDKSFNLVSPLNQNDGQTQFDKKVFEITKAKKDSSGKLFEGRTWWPSHAWNETDKYCASSSHVTTRVGHLGMAF